MLTKVLVLLAVPFAVTLELNEVFKWKEVSFQWPNTSMKLNWIKSGTYIPSNNIPFALERWRNKLFVTLPRLKVGGAATLSYIPLQTTSTSPALIPYPSWEFNSVPDNTNTSTPFLVSVFRVRADICDRLWVLDMGLMDVLGQRTRLRNPSLFVFDLNTNSVIRRYVLKKRDFVDITSFENLVVDVQPGKCDEAFAYFADISAYALVIYSWALNDSWRVEHNYFHIDPFQGDVIIDGLNLVLNQGLYGATLGKVQDDGYKPLIFHPMVSTKEFQVSTEILQNKSFAVTTEARQRYRVLGEKGNYTQSTGSSYDPQTDVLFETLITRDGFGCWKYTKPLVPENFDQIAQDSTRLIFTSDLIIDQQRNLWIISNEISTYVTTGLNANRYHFRIFKIPVDNAIRNTACA